MARESGGHASRPKPSLRTELLFNLGVLAAGALLLAVVSSALAPLLGHGLLGFAFLVVLIGADLVIFVALGAYLVSRLITKPMEALMDATGAVASGELGRRAPAGETRELDRLAESVNRMTERLLDAQGALVRAAKLASVGRLAAGVAHEVGNPLAAIGNYVELLRRRGVEPDLVAAVGRETGRIDAIVRSLLDYARPEDAAREPLDLGGVAVAAVDLLRTQGVLREVSVEVTGAPGASRVLGDRVALEQVFVNLLLNAVDAAGDGGRIAVASSATLVDGAPVVQVLVADSGPGVRPDLAVRVFEPFFTTKPPGSGTGLGLAIVQRIVEDHGGRVDVAAAREGGAAFTVTLPALQA